MNRFSQLWSFLLFLWTGTASILDLDGEPVSAAGGSSDTGSGLDPNG